MPDLTTLEECHKYIHRLEATNKAFKQCIAGILNYLAHYVPGFMPDGYKAPNPDDQIGGPTIQ